LNLIDKLSRYLVDDEYKVTIMNDGVHIINYVEIVDFSSVKVIIRYKDGITILNGCDLVVSKMLEDELFITGKLKSVEYN